MATTEDMSVPCFLCRGTGIGGVRDEEIGTDYNCPLCDGQGEFANEWALAAYVIEQSHALKRLWDLQREEADWEYQREVEEAAGGY